ncbi:hypothetical protein EG68_05088 [Paragonimus skrjabini miyazakii]|uniref:Secreted protein n=1 Tax=Paragonimus skrjabini miyazakii TaxID=59628 RepID=A0A8S9YZU6_9TREM|nr:hypothetical protein EG68_05088 [Paragonimus skrjabini miyazakii]
MITFLLTLLYLLGTESKQECPRGFGLVKSTICITDMGRVKDFCSAGRKCASVVSTHGQRAFVIGRDYELTLPQRVTQNSCTWSSINDGFAQALHGIKGYRDGDPRTPNYETPTKSLKWLYDRPSRDSPFATFDDNGLLNETSKCARNWECRSVYFNQHERICLHMKYVDALIPRLYTTIKGSWTRFVNTGIEH